MLKPIQVIIISIAAACAMSASAQQAPEAALQWVSTYTRTPHAMDGVMDAPWESAVPLTVTVREAMGGGAPPGGGATGAAYR